MRKIAFLRDVVLIKLPNFVDKRGGLTVVSEKNDIPFEIRRVFFTYQTQYGVKRGEHAHKSCTQFLICPQGTLEVEVSDGIDRKTFKLENPSHGLLIPPLIWSIQKEYSKNAVCLVLASEDYSQSEYIRSVQELLEIRKTSQGMSIN